MRRHRQVTTAAIFFLHAGELVAARQISAMQHDDVLVCRCESHQSGSDGEYRGGLASGRLEDAVAGGRVDDAGGLGARDESRSD
jgi:hypothetical protein